MSCYLNYSVSKLFGWCWWFYFLLLVVLMDCFGSVVNCEFTYGYGAQEYTLALINITYTHPVTGKIHSEKNEIGKFTSGKIGSANGVVVHVSSNNHTMHDGCNPFDSEIIPHEPWIALIAHGYCRDTIKLQHAVENNASAAIIYSNEYNSFGLQLHHQVFDLVAVFISEEEGEKIAALVDNGTRVDIHISVGTPNTFRYANINRTSVLFVSISFIILMIISLAWLVFYYVQRFRYIHAKDILARRLYIAAKKALDKIPVKTLKLSDQEAEGEFECCAVCIEMFKLGEVVRTLPCKHTFHKSCVDPWLLDQRSCPMCKMDILKYYGLVITDSQESVLNNDDMDFPNMHHGEDLGIIHVPVHQHPAPNQSCSPERREVRSASHSASSNRADCSLFIPIQSSTQPLGQNCSTSSPDLPSPSIWGFKSEDELFLCPELEAGYQEQSDSSNSSQDPLMVTQDKEVRENPEVN